MGSQLQFLAKLVLSTFTTGLVLAIVVGKIQQPVRAQAILLESPPGDSEGIDGFGPLPVPDADPSIPIPVNPPLRDPLPRSNGICPADFGRSIAQIINRPQFARARWGIMAELPNEQVPLYSYNSERLLIPASNNKLFTTAAALKVLYPSPNLAALTSRINIINRYSDNYASDRLLSQIGGAQRVKSVLAPLGIDPQGFRQVDGSGLSRANLAKPATIVNLLKAMYFDDARKLFYYSLPLSGVSGTLQNRFRGTPLQAKIRAKTGTLSGVRALSGYMDQPALGTMIFSIIVNQPGQSGDVLVQAVDRVAMQLSRLAPCTAYQPSW